MELGAHHVVVVPRQHGQAVAGLPVPDTHRLSAKRKTVCFLSLTLSVSSDGRWAMTDPKKGLTRDQNHFLKNARYKIKILKIL